MYAPLGFALLLQGDAVGAMTALARAHGDADADTGLAAFYGLSQWSRLEPLDLRSYRSPFYDSIRDDPRWEALLATVGLSNQQLAALHLRFTVPL